MAKQSAPIQEVARLLDLVPFLSTHSHISLKELSQEFGVDEKSMASELTALSMCGLPGYTPYELIEIFFDSGFVTINNHEALDIPRALTHLEVASLLIGLHILRDQTTESDGQVREKIDNLLLQLRALVGSSIEVDEDPLAAHRALINSAIASRKSLEISYTAAAAHSPTTRHIDPLSLTYELGHSYLVAHCHSSKGVRNFRLDRISSVRLLDTPAEESAPASTSGDGTISVDLKVTGSRRAIAELFLTGPIAGDGQISVDIYSPEWLTAVVVAHSPDLILMAPQDLRQRVKGALENILALYTP